jgi:hypothetical protein
MHLLQPGKGQASLPSMIDLHVLFFVDKSLRVSVSLWKDSAELLTGFLVGLTMGLGF